MLKKNFYVIAIICFCKIKLFSALPMITEDVPTVTKSKFEFEYSLKISKEISMSWSLKYGIFKNIDIGISLSNSLDFKNFETQMTTKINLVKDLISLSLTQEAWRLSTVLLILERNIEIFNFYFNVGVQENGIFYNIAIERTFNKFDVIIENIEQNYFNFGCRIKFTDSLNLGIGINTDFGKTNYSLGIHKEF